MTRSLTNIPFWNKNYVSRRHYPSMLSYGDDELLRRIHPYLMRKLGGTLLEVGCGNSYWLPYLAKEYALKVSGIDFSSERLNQAEDNLRQHGMIGNLMCADVLNNRPTYEKFDIVCSFGVVEHFDQPTDILRILTSYVNSQGILITSVPHLKGFWGSVSRKVSKNISQGYLELDLQDLRQMHETAELHILYAEYMRWLDFGVVNYSELPDYLRIMAEGFALALNALLMITRIPRIRILPKKYYSDMLVIAEVNK